MNGQTPDRIAVIVAGLDAVRTTQQEIALQQQVIASGVARVEVIAVGARDQARTTNGRVSALELWRAELKGIGRGSGNVGQLLLYLLAATGTISTIVTAIVNWK